MYGSRLAVALLVSETVGNSLRHAFPDGRSGRIRVGLRRAGPMFELTAPMLERGYDTIEDGRS